MVVINDVDAHADALKDAHAHVVSEVVSSPVLAPHVITN